MSRFADPNVTDRLSLGACQCPGTPHEDDWIELRTEVGAADLQRISAGDSLDALAMLAVSWNLLESDGTKAPVDRAHVDRLYADIFEPFNAWTDTHMRMVTLPNAPAAPSPSSSRGRDSRPLTAVKAS